MKIKFHKRKRGKWGKLKVTWKTAIKGGRSMSKEAKGHLHAAAMLAALEGKPSPPGVRLLSIGWANPQAGRAGRLKIVNVQTDPAWLTAANGLPTLDRGGWLARKLEARIKRKKG